MVSSLEKKIDETEKKYEEANKISEERLKQALEAESKIIQLKTAMQRWLLWSSFFLIWVFDFAVVHVLFSTGC